MKNKLSEIESAVKASLNEQLEGVRIEIEDIRYLQREGKVQVLIALDKILEWLPDFPHFELEVFPTLGGIPMVFADGEDKDPNVWEVKPVRVGT